MGYRFITNVDFSQSIVNYMAEKNRNLDEMEYSQLDLCQEGLEGMDEQFNFVIDKALLDCIACSAEPERHRNRVLIYLENMYKFLVPGGIYVCVSRGSPETRLIYLQSKGLKWSIETIKIQKGNAGSQQDTFDRIDTEPFYFVYVCTKDY